MRKCNYDLYICTEGFLFHWGVIKCCFRISGLSIIYAEELEISVSLNSLCSKQLLYDIIAPSYSFINKKMKLKIIAACYLVLFVLRIFLHLNLSFHLV